MGADRNQWQFPKNVGGNLIGWRNDGKGLENKAPGVGFASAEQGAKADSAMQPPMYDPDSIAADAFDQAKHKDFTGDAIASKAIPASVDALVTSGASAAGDGGALLYKRVVSEPSHDGKRQSSDGAWWEDPFFADYSVSIPSDFGTLQSAVDLSLIHI